MEPDQTNFLEFVQGNESHSSNWGNFYIKGLEKYQVKEEFPENRYDKHSSYQGYCCYVPDGVIFTISEKSGDKYGTSIHEFAICVSDSFKEDHKEGEKWEEWYPEYGDGFLKGNFRVLARGVGKTKAPRLEEWWATLPKSSQNEKLALHLGKYIEKRGVKNPPALFEIKEE